MFIVVCNNTNVSKLVFDYIAGWEKHAPRRLDRRWCPGELAALQQRRGRRRWTARPNTILVDSEQLESGEAMSAEFKKIAAREIEEFKAEYRTRFPGRDADELTDEDLLREVMNTVGKPGKLGEHVKCVVSVSMLTEGWDANTVTHILGVRAFGTQLLCEQVVGRGLRRMSYAANDRRADSSPNMPRSTACRSRSSPAPARRPTRSPARSRRASVRSRTGSTARSPSRACRLPLRSARPNGSTPSSPTTRSYALSTADMPTKTENAPIVGEASIHTLDDLEAAREHEVAFLLAQADAGETTSATTSEATYKPWLFPQLLAITRRWLAECVDLQGQHVPAAAACS